MKDPLIKGHPLHAMLSDVPIGALITSAVFDGLWLAGPSDTWHQRRASGAGARTVVNGRCQPAVQPAVGPGGEPVAA